MRRRRCTNAPAIAKASAGQARRGYNCARMSFPATRPSVVRDLGSVDPVRRAAAYEALARSYWRPVYVYIRLRWRRGPEDAQDLTQEFFTRAFEREYLSRYDPAKARFRTFVRTCLDGFLANEDKAAARLKRGGGVTHRRRRLRALRRGPRGPCAQRRAGSGAVVPSRVDPRPVRRRRRSAARALRRRGTRRAFTLFTRYDIEGPTRGAAADLRDPRARDRTARDRRHQRARLGAPRLPRDRPATCCATCARATKSSAPRRATSSGSIRHDRRSGPVRRSSPKRAKVDSSDAAIDRLRASTIGRTSARPATSCSRRSDAAAWGSCSADATASSIATSRSR